MARSSLKKSVKASQYRLLQFFILTVVLKIMSVGLQLSKAVSLNDIQLLSTTLLFLSEMACIGFLWHQSKAVYDKDGLLVDCIDITDSKSLGSYSYVIDTIMLLWIVEVGSIYSRKFYVLIVIALMAAILKIIAATVPSASPSNIVPTVRSSKENQKSKLRDKNRMRFLKR